jgi:hypothetical protein
VTRQLPPGSTRDRRWWHRAWVPIGAHRPQIHWPVRPGVLPLHECRCGWIGTTLGDYARSLTGPLPPGHEHADNDAAREWIWLPRRVWEHAFLDQL